MKHTINTLTIILLIFPVLLQAFDGNKVTDFPLTLEIPQLETITTTNTPYPITIKLSNSAAVPLTVKLSINNLLPEMHLEDNTPQTVSIPANQTISSTFNISCDQNTLSALYPIHTYATFNYENTPHTTHAVQIVETALPPLPAKQKNACIKVHANAVLNLTRETPQFSWKFFGQPENTMPLGFNGTDQLSGTHLNQLNIQRGDFRPAIIVHPPWRTHSGTAFLQYQLELPKTTPITLNFANAIRNNSTTEPASDGVTFRVWVNNTSIYENHTDAKIWQDAEVDLSEYAGTKITLRLETHPGPHKNTTCDTAYWASPTIIAGSLPKLNTTDNWQAQRKTAIELLNKPTLNTIQLSDNYKTSIVCGPNGLIDGSIAIGTPDKHITFDGFDISLLYFPVCKKLSGITVTDYDITYHNRSITVDHTLSYSGLPAKLSITIFPNHRSINFAVKSNLTVTDLALGPASQLANRVYYGHGYCIEDPGTFQVHYGGHELSTSHVGFDFNSGISLLTATSNPPDDLIVNPSQKSYALHTHMNSTLTLVPSTANAFDAALAYRSIYPKQPAPAFLQKAGRFVFDIWGGRYSEITDYMKQLIDYGLTDSMLTLHVWQRYGYDYRLPDIFPPNPEFGSLQDLQALGTLCDTNNIPWGLHDNYIDFYPDAQNFSYDKIAFRSTGEPIKAWLMESRDAQSYRWRPDCIMPFVKRNIELVKNALHPSHYFIDVFTSIDCFDFYDRSGKFHSFLETQHHWGQAFNYIRNQLGHQAIMTSEAGDDLLVGQLDGADCQFLTLSNTPGSFEKYIPCQHWQRVPWFDAVLHDKFSLHGVGYSNRYQGSRTREAHGILSDDYISAEILTGHSLMADREASIQGAVRKYYLAQDFIRSIATDTIQNVEFIDNNIDHQKTTWNSGAVVYINRSPQPWQIANKLLPQYGYYAANGLISSSVETIDNITVEQSSTPDSFYLNARGYSSPNQLEITPLASSIQQIDNSNFKLIIDWTVNSTTNDEPIIFIHFTDPHITSGDEIVFQGDFRPAIPASKWEGRITTGQNRTIHIPDNLPTGKYEILIGMWNPANGYRYKLRGIDRDNSRFLLGYININRNNDQTSISLEKCSEKPQPAWGNIAHKMVKFDQACTSGAFQCKTDKDKLTITPLPQLPPFEIQLSPKILPTGTNLTITAITHDGTRKPINKYIQDKYQFTFYTSPEIIKYEINNN